MNWLKDEKCEKYCVASRSLPPTSLALAIIRSHHERQERTIWTPFRPGRSRGPRQHPVCGGATIGRSRVANVDRQVCARAFTAHRRDATVAAKASAHRPRGRV